MKIFESDWICSEPFFYNEKTGKFGSNINDVIDFSDFEFHPEGLKNYLDFGYSVFEQTPIKHVKFLRHSSRLERGPDGKLNVRYLADPACEWYGKTTCEEEVLEWIRDAIGQWESHVDGEIVLPISGGYDSRLLACMVREKSKIRAFTYGISRRQEESFEVVHARKLCEILGIRWRHIHLGGFHSHFEEWNGLYGPSTHAHGMYHITFYESIRQFLPPGLPFLSGIFGDVWAGNVKTVTIQSPEEIVGIGYTHGLNADSRFLKMTGGSELRDAFWEENRTRLNNPFWQIIHTIRLKMILISYLLKLPRHFKFIPWSPFLDIRIALGMLCLPAERRNNRIWQKEFFSRNGIELESMGLKSTRSNTLDMDTLRMQPLPPLRKDLLGEIIQVQYLDWINRYIRLDLLTFRMRHHFNSIRRIRGLLSRIGINDPTYKAYSAYLTVKPLEYLLEKRGKA